MSYCIQILDSPGDIAPAIISKAQLDQLANDEESGIDPQDAINQAINAADSEIDSYCSVKYNTPFNPVPDRIKNLSADIAVYRLYYKRSASLGMPEAVRKSYEDAISFLKDVSTGKASLGVTPEPTVNSLNKAEVKSNERMFSRKSMSGF